MDDLRAMGRVLVAEEWSDEAAIVEAIGVALADQRPACIADLHAEWREPFLLLTIVHADGGMLEVCDGDALHHDRWRRRRFPRIPAPDDLIAVLRAAFTGQLTNVRHYRLGYKTGDYFEPTGTGRSLVGAQSQVIAGLPGPVLRSLPFLRDAVQCTRVRFDRTPAFSAVPA